MKIGFIVAWEHNNTWETVYHEVPDDVIDPKFVRGSVKWTAKVLKWFRSSQPTTTSKAAYVGVIDLPEA